MATQAQLAAVQQLYVGYLGRAADSAGQKFWADAIANGTATIKSVATGFTLSAEYKAAYAGLSTDALVEKVYNNVLGRTPDAEGKAFWVAALAKGTVTADTLVATIVTNLGALDQATINNKVFVSQTYTDAAGTAYNPTAGAAVLVGVDSTPASVATAIAGITNGTLAGLTPGANLIAAVATAATAIDTYAKAAAGTNPTFDTSKDGSVSSVEATAAFDAAVTARALPANGDVATTATLAANVTNANAAAAAAKAIVSAVTGGTAAVAAYDAALAAQKAVLGSAADQVATASANAAAKAAFGPAFAGQTTVTFTTLNDKTAAVGDITDAATLYTVLTTLTNAVERANLVTEVNKVGPTGVALVAAADKEVAATKAAALVASTKDTLEAIDTDAVTPLVQPTDYATKVGAATAATDLLAKATTADAAIAAAKVVTDQYVILNKATTDATAAITAFNVANANKINIAALAGATAEGSALAAVKDVFFFPAKIAGTNDMTIGTTTAFSAGDALVLGSGYSFNSGALSTGNNSALEVFFVKGASGTQVVIETNAVGSATSVVGADGTVTAHADVAVINLVGVTADHLSFANGVVSYV